MIVQKTRKNKLDRNLKQITEILKKKYKPEKMILFGSLSSGRINENSDIDLLIIKNTKKSSLLRKREVRSLTHPKIAFDPIILTPEEIKLRLKWQDFFIKEIINKGKVLYAK